jgi:serine/threonine-protein kinase
MAGMVMGSPKYMSPEQVVGQTVDGRSDIFSLGVVLYEMLTGKTPFVGDNISAIMYQILNEEPIPPKAFNQNIPDSINYIILRALAKHPDARYQTAKEMGRDLRKYKTLEIPAPGEPVSPPAAPMDRRKTPREALGDATQVISRGTEDAAGVSPASAKLAGAKHMLRRWSLPQLVLLAGIPLLLVAFVLMVMPRKAAEEPAVAQGDAEKAVDQPARETTPAPTGAPELPAAAPVEPTVAEAKPGAEPAKRAAAPGEKKIDSRAKPGKASKSEAALVESKVVTETPAPVPPGSATLELAIAPWGEVFVDGVRQGVTPPLRELKLQPGKHTILIVNQTFTPYSQTIDVQPNGTHKIKYKFTK